MVPFDAAPVRPHSRFSKVSAVLQRGCLEGISKMPD